MITIIAVILVGYCSFMVGYRAGKRSAWDDFALNYIVIHKSTIIKPKKSNKGRTVKCKK